MRSHMATLAPPGEYDSTCASFCPPESTIQTANRPIQPFLHSSLQKVPILRMGSSSPKLPLAKGDLDPHLILGSLRPPESSTQTVSRSFHPFLHRRPQSVPILYSGTPLPLSKLPLPTGDLDPHLIHGSLGPPESSTKTVSRSFQPFLHKRPLSVECPYTLQWDAPFLPRNCPFP